MINIAENIKYSNAYENRYDAFLRPDRVIKSVCRMFFSLVLIGTLIGTASAHEKKTDPPYGFFDLEAIDDYADFTNYEGPVVAINLFKFKSAQHAERFWEETANITTPYLFSIGATFVYSGPVIGEFSMGREWDYVTLVQYPSFADVQATLEHPDVGRRVQELREKALKRAQFLVTIPYDQVDGSD